MIDEDGNGFGPFQILVALFAAFIYDPLREFWARITGRPWGPVK